jgi:hypothetical protein
MDQSKTMAEHSDLPQGLSLSAFPCPCQIWWKPLSPDDGESSLSTTVILSERHAAYLQQQIAGISFIPFM